MSQPNDPNGEQTPADSDLDRRITSVGDNIGTDAVGSHPITQTEDYVNPALDMLYEGPDADVLCPATRPGIYRALNLLIEDSYGPTARPITSGLAIPPWWSPHVPEIEQFVGSLSDELAAPEDGELMASLPDAAESLHVANIMDSELWSFVNGEDTVANAIAQRSRAGVLAHVFLNDMFEGFGGYDAEHPPVLVDLQPGDPRGKCYVLRGESGR